jgi:hypothetical protein
MDFSSKNHIFKGKCRNGWTRYKHKCLKFFDDLEPHSDAEKICQSIGGTLISIHSAEENKFATYFANGLRTRNHVVWIGAKRNNSLDYFEWTNGQKFNYNNWGSGEPKNSSDSESVVAMDSYGTWFAYGISLYKLIFICESDLSDE